MNRLKRCVTLDMKSDEGRATIHRLAAISDVVIQNQKPGLAAKLKFDAATLRKINPRLIYANIHAFGDTGPLASIDCPSVSRAAISANRSPIGRLSRG